MSDTQYPDMAPEAHNSEQDDESAQAQQIAQEARNTAVLGTSPLDSTKPKSGDDDSSQDLIDHMRDMEASGRIDMGAYAGEETHDDEEDMYGEAAAADNEEE